MKQNLDEIPRNLGRDFPILNYQRLAAAVVDENAHLYMKALRFMNTGTHSKREENLCKRDIYECEEFFQSERFEIYMPNTDGSLFMNLLKEKAKQPYKMSKWVYVR